MSNARQTEESARGFFFTATIVFAVLLVVLGSHLPAGMGLAGLRSQQGAYDAVWPQGWAFFAKISEQDRVVVYRTSADGSLKSVTQRHMTDASLWGLDRSTDALSGETAYIYGRIPAAYWSPCPHPDGLECGSAPPVVDHVVTNDLRGATLCGPTVFVIERSEPGGPGLRVATEVAAVDLRCV